MSWTDLAKCHRKNPDYSGTRDLISMLSVLLPCCVTLGKLLNLSDLWFYLCKPQMIFQPASPAPCSSCEGVGKQRVRESLRWSPVTVPYQRTRPVLLFARLLPAGKTMAVFPRSVLFPCSHHPLTTAVAQIWLP